MPKEEFIAEDTAPKKKRGTLFHLFDVALNIVIILAIVGVIRTFLVSPFQVEGHSMDTTLADQEYIIINKFSYFIDEPNRGDIVVFRPPTDPRKHYVKRIIGLPGETIIIRDGFVYIKRDKEGGEIRLPEPYLDPRNLGHTYKHPPGSGNTEEVVYEVPTNEFFLLGDNRMGSLDSRSFTGAGNTSMPYVDKENIKGRVWFVALPITKIHAFEPPLYGF